MGVVLGRRRGPCRGAGPAGIIYLASTSPRRKKILKDAGIRFRIVIPGYHEKKLRGAGPRRLVRAHALGKGLAAAKEISEGTVLSADTIVYSDGRIIGKPRDLKHAFRILGSLQGRWHEVYTGVAVLNVRKGKVTGRRVLIEKTRVLLKPLKPEEIAAYFKKIDPLDKAGAYAIQETKNSVVEAVKGSFLNAVGLPLERVRRLII